MKSKIYNFSFYFLICNFLLSPTYRKIKLQNNFKYFLNLQRFYMYICYIDKNNKTQINRIL